MSRAVLGWRLAGVMVLVMLVAGCWGGDKPKPSASSRAVPAASTEGRIAAVEQAERTRPSQVGSDGSPSRSPSGNITSGSRPYGWPSAEWSRMTTDGSTPTRTMSPSSVVDRSTLDGRRAPADRPVAMLGQTGGGADSVDRLPADGVVPREIPVVRGHPQNRPVKPMFELCGRAHITEQSPSISYPPSIRWTRPETISRR